MNNTVQHSLVGILDYTGKIIGTGFFVSLDGYILTCKHNLDLDNYNKNNQVVFIKYDNDSTIYESKIVIVNDEEDIAILQTTNKYECYIPLCDLDISSLMVDCYGYPKNSKNRIKTSVSCAQLYDDNKYIQLDRANSITFGFSGAPVLYDGVAVGLLFSVTQKDENGRLTEIAFAISAKLILKIFPNYVSETDLPLEFDKMINTCNEAIRKSQNKIKVYAWDELDFDSIYVQPTLSYKNKHSN